MTTVREGSHLVHYTSTDWLEMINDDWQLISSVRLNLNRTQWRSRRQEAGTKIKQHFANQFSDRTRTTALTPLKNPITAYELERAFRRLRNGRAP
ncbi:unnamed protein product [Peronospora belbahrii]|uniref:Uncharacterized protein n=1 Tax=Peronospora belbahrii TaxID=622444 RepID=A0AAU9KLX6_9STRA|nr:unnamed protein product [Peronospora belbahrii]